MTPADRTLALGKVRDAGGDHASATAALVEALGIPSDFDTVTLVREALATAYRAGWCAADEQHGGDGW